MHKTRSLRATVLAVACSLSMAVFAQDGEPKPIDIPPGDLISGLRSLTQQSGAEFVYREDQLAGRKTKGVRGQLTAEQALSKLLEGSGYTVKRDPSGVLMIVKTSSTRGSSLHKDNHRSKARSPESIEEEQQTTNLPALLVRGQHTLNTDIVRSRDDIQPYVVFERPQIEMSAADNLGVFLKQRLTMNTASSTRSQIGDVTGNISEVNLRGLGARQTLILVNGRRMAETSNSTPMQTNLNGIPMSAVERIEVLPATAAGIYGGGATGGVINVILRKDYEGIEVGVSYGVTSEGGGANLRHEFTAGFPIGEHTTAMVTASSTRIDSLERGERDFFQNYQLRRFANAPDLLYQSAIPPLGATPNIRSADGSPLFGEGTPAFTYMPKGYIAQDGLSPLLANAGHYNLEPADSLQSFGGAGTYGSHRLALTGAHQQTISASLRRDLSGHAELYADISTARSKSRYPTSPMPGSFTLLASAPNNPFGQDVIISAPFANKSDTFKTTNTEYNMILGSSFKLGKWFGIVDLSYSRSATDVIQSGFFPALTSDLASGRIDAFKDTSTWEVGPLGGFIAGSRNGPHESNGFGLVAKFSGTLATTYAGDITTTFSAEARRQQLAQLENATYFFPEQYQDIYSLYGEASIPLARGEGRGLKALDAMIAVRTEQLRIHTAPGLSVARPEVIKYVEKTYDATKPTLGLKYQPFDSLMLRASYGKGFTPPSLNMYAPSTPPPFPVSIGIDRKRGNTVAGPFIYQYGGNPNIKPEQSTSLSIGAVWKAQDRTRLSLDYNRIHKRNDINNPDAQFILDHEDLYPGRVIRGERLAGDPSDWAGPVTMLDVSYINLAHTEVESLDFSGDYNKELGEAGRLELRLTGTRFLHYRVQAAPGEATVENVGVTYRYPPDYKLGLSAGWQWRSLWLGWNSSYISSYQVAIDPDVADAAIVRAQGGRRVEAQLYHDFSARYWIDRAGSLWDNSEIRLAVSNVLNRKPPFDALSSNTGYYSPYGDPRLRYVLLSLHKRF